MQDEARQLGAEMEAAIGALAIRLVGRDTAQARQVTAFATVDLPYAAVRRYVAAREPVPPILHEMIRASGSAVIAEALS